MHHLTKDPPERRPRIEALRSAFSVIELLAVLAILGIMAITVAISVNAII